MTLFNIYNMILDKEVEIVVNNHNLLYYKQLGYDAKYREALLVKPLDLSIGSHYNVNVSCDLCFDISFVQYRQLKGKEDYLCSSCAAKNKKSNRIKKIKIESKVKVKKEKPIKKDKDEVIRNRKLTRLIRYGDENYNNQEKKRLTLLEKYGDENYNNTIKRKETLFEIYGDSCYNNQEKKEKTCLYKYGVRHTNQLDYVMDKIGKSAKKLKIHINTRLYYRGTYEKDFLDLCFNRGIDIDIFNGELYYYVNDVKHRYYPDFFHKKSNTIIEIKSTYIFNYNLAINELKKKCCIENGFNFLFIIDKKYDDFLLL